MIGTKLAHYEITAHIGSGGMGDVYQATDTKLGRSVAVKFLPEAFSHDTERVARFQREARVLASLNHPNIAAIHGVEEIDTRHFLVMELVPGETLADRITRGAIPIEEALPIAKQIADALEEAHEKGVIHRDLKPANIKVTREGKVKVLDFGLAKAYEREQGYAALSNSPTLSLAATNAGVILGTAAYMSPEQASGKSVDKRADIWSFGAALFEMLAGKQALGGESASDTLANVLKLDPDWTALPSDTPGSISILLRRCLTKDRRQRLQAIGEARIAIESATYREPNETDTNKASTLGRSLYVAAGWIAAALFGVVAAWGWLRSQPQEDLLLNMALTIVPAKEGAPVESGRFISAPLISPDGSFVVYRAARGGLRLRRLDSLREQPLRGTEDNRAGFFWSSDSRFVVFDTPEGWKKIRVPDGATELIGLAGALQTGSWSDTGKLIAAGRAATGFGLYTLSATGGKAQTVDVPVLKEGSYWGAEFLPGGEDFLFAFLPQGASEAEIYLATLRGNTANDPVLLFKNNTAPHFTPAFGGRMLFVRNDTLFAQRFNRKTRKLEGDPEPVEQGVASSPAYYLAEFSVSHQGIVAWRAGEQAGLSQITIFDRQGTPVSTAGPPSPVSFLRLSPDETHLIVADEQSAWLLEPDRPARLPLGLGLWRFWSPDGLRLIGLQGTKIVERGVAGSPQLREVANAPGIERFEDVSPDGKLALYRTDLQSGFSVRLDASIQERVSKPELQTGESIINTRFSPDGHWVVYRTLSTSTAQPAIYVQPFPGPGLRKQIASGDSAYPVWRKDGKEILYLGRSPDRTDNSIWSVSVGAAGNDLHFGTPTPLFAVRPPPQTIGMDLLAVSRDGSRIFFPQPIQVGGDSNLIHIRSGWAQK